MGIVCMHTNQPNYTRGLTGVPVGILWHSTGCNNPYLKRYVSPSSSDPNQVELSKIIGSSPNTGWNKSSYSSAGVNAFIGKKADGTVDWCQVLPWTTSPWGVGAGCYGSLNYLKKTTGTPFWIQFEICEDALTDAAYANDCYDKAIEMCAMLCDKYGIDPKGYYEYNGLKIPTILCHQTASRLGWGANHGDIYHWSKLCKGKAQASWKYATGYAYQKYCAKSGSYTLSEIKTKAKTNYGLADPAMDMIRSDILTKLTTTPSNSVTVSTPVAAPTIADTKTTTTIKTTSDSYEPTATITVRQLYILNMSGKEVLSASQLLKQKGYLSATSDKYTSTVQESVRKYQKTEMASNDGLIGPNTWKNLLGAKSAISSGTVAKIVIRQLYYKSKSMMNGKDVLAMQQLLAEKGYLSTTPDGYFGPITEKALRAFQNEVIGIADGICGPNTWNRLING